jgi:hypothetical protein
MKHVSHTPQPSASERHVKADSASRTGRFSASTAPSPSAWHEPGLTEADRIGHPCPRLWETHTTIREGPHNAATGDGDIYDARARQFAVTAGNYIAPAAGSPSVQRGEPTERMVREAAFSMVCTTIPEIKSRILTTRHPQ